MFKFYSRRQFIQNSLQGILLFFGVTLTACQGDTKKAEEKNDPAQPVSCDDLSGLSESDLKQREAFGYVRESPVAGNQCDNCNLWAPNEADPSCGKCLLFKGPVHAGGHCTYWAPQS